MSAVLTIPAQEAHVVRVFAVMDTPGAPLDDAAVLAALGADGDLETDEIELFDLGDLGAMPLSDYLIDGHGIAAADLADMRGQLDGLPGRVLIVPSRAFGGRAMVLRPGRGLRLVARLEEFVPEVRFERLPAGGTMGTVAASSKGAGQPRRVARLATGAFLAGLAVLAAVVVWLVAAR